MKKCVLLLIVPLLFFFGCEEESNSNECLLYGTWDFYSEDGYSDDCMVYCNASILESPCNPENIYVGDLCAQLTFNEDGSFIYSQENPSYYYEGSWTSGCQVGDLLSAIEYKDFESDWVYVINSISSNSLTLTEGDYYRLVLKK